MAFESLDKRQQALCAPFNFLANKERSAGIYLMIKLLGPLEFILSLFKDLR